MLIVLPILATGIFAAYESINRLGNPREIDYLWIVAMAAVIGFAGNEGVALYRMKVGKEIGSAALSADGHHVRVDGLTAWRSSLEPWVSGWAIPWPTPSSGW